MTQPEQLGVTAPADNAMLVLAAKVYRVKQEEALRHQQVKDLIASKKPTTPLRGFTVIDKRYLYATR